MSEPQFPKADDDRVFETAGELLALLSTPVRLKVLSALCNGERKVSDWVAATSTKDLDGEAVAPRKERLFPSSPSI